MGSDLYLPQHYHLDAVLCQDAARMGVLWPLEAAAAAVYAAVADAVGWATLLEHRMFI